MKQLLSWLILGWFCLLFVPLMSASKAPAVLGMSVATINGKDSKEEKKLEAQLAVVKQYGDTEAWRLVSKLEEASEEIAAGVVEQWVLELARKRSAGELNRLGRDVYKLAGMLHSCKAYLFAFELFRQAAKFGSIAAENNVAMCLETGNGVDKDAKRAAALYLKNAEKNPLARIRLARCLQYGIGVGRDEELAVALYEDVAKRPNITAKDSADAKYRLGICLVKGVGGKRDEKEGFFWLSQAAVLGFREAMHALAQCYTNGWGVAQDKTQALGWLLMGGYCSL